MRRPTLALTALVLIAPAAMAQGMDHSQHQMGGQSVAAVRPLYEQFKGWLIASAEQMPEADYAYRPTAGVRSFGELLGHVANAQYMFCATATGGQRPQVGNMEEVTSKAELVAGLKAAFAYCDPAYQMADAKAMEEVTLFGNKGSRLWALTFNAMHNAEHYGNLVTYTRMKGMTPPSSQQ